MQQKWTNAQENAINAKNSNILVSAAAGSGKTAVLVERVIKMITDPYSPVKLDELLIVTFTNAAAAEMKSRIFKSLNEKLKEFSNDTNIQNQLALLPSAKICTIDSFCINLVRDNFFKLNITQDFKILDTPEQMLLEQTAVDFLVEELYENEENDFSLLVEAMSKSKNDSELTTVIRKISEYINAHPYPMQWLYEMVEMYNPDTPLDATYWKEYAYSEISDVLDFAFQLINSSRNALSLDDEMYDGYMNMLNEDEAVFVRIKDSLETNWDNVKSVIESASFSTMPSKRGYVSEAKELISNNRNIYKKDLFSKDLLPVVCVNQQDYKYDCQQIYPVLKLLVKAIEKYNEKLRELKDEIESYTFSDIEHFAIELLFKYENGYYVRTELAEEYKNQFYEILVDEYQDTNSAQDKLFEMLSNDKNRFMVGDVKQSIYGFRLAMPQIFNNKKTTFDPYETENSTNQKIILDKNFRSRKGICEFTNFVFSNLMSEKVGEMEYTNEEYLNSHDAYLPTNVPCAQLTLVQTPENEDKDEFEAVQIAKLIQSKINSKEQIQQGEGHRDVRYGDFAILLRTTKDRLPKYSKVLTEYGIPVVSNNKTNLFENNEIVILLSLLRVVDNPAQDIPLLATLMSVLYGYTADDIATAKVNASGKNLFASVSNSKEIFNAFLNDLDKYQKYAASMSVESFLRQVINETSYLSLISAMGNSEQRRLNVMKLIDLAKRFDSGQNVGLTAFMRFIDSVVDSGVGIESATLSNANDNCVQIMSVHQSKGLEFPVCILAGAAHSYNMRDLYNLVQLNPNYGIGLKVHNEEGMYRYNSLQYSCIKSMNLYASLSESLRVLYVAITRAKEQFISFVSCSDIDKYVSNLANKIVDGKLLPNVLKRISSDGDFLTLCALIHKDGIELRNKSSNYIPYDSDFDFDMKISFALDSDDFVPENEVAVESSDETVNAIKEKLNFTYNRYQLANFVSKRAASSLDDKEKGFEYFAKAIPAFLDKDSMTAAQKGTAMHAFMQFCKYESAKNSLDDEINRLVNASFITQEQAESLDKAKLSKLFNSSFGERLFSSDSIYREIKVSSCVPVCEVEDTEFTDSVLIQGIADCVFEENGELVLVDYKTDKVENEEQLLDRYKKQVAFYRNAVEKTLNKPVKEALLYSFYLDKECIYK